MQDLPLWLRKRVSAAYIPGCEFFLSLHVLARSPASSPPGSFRCFF